MTDRYTFWADFINREGVTAVTEIGVWRGQFAQHLLTHCPGIKHYYLVDPWRHLDDWNKPANRDDNFLEGAFAETRERIEPFAAKCTILRGRTVEVDLPEVDFTYVDGDHTLRGIMIDLIRAWPRTRWLGGDDFGTIWQHAGEFEPTMIFPAAVHFAEAVDAPFQLFGNQYLIGGDGGFDYHGDTSLLPHIMPRQRLREQLADVARAMFSRARPPR